MIAYIMKKALLLISLFLLTACTSNETKSLAIEIKEEYQSRIAAQFDMFTSFGIFDSLNENDCQPPIVKDVKVFYLIGDKYIGIAKVEIDGKQQTKIIHISAEEDGYYWEVLQ